MKRTLLALPLLLAGCGGGGGGISNNDYARSYSGTYARALVSAPNTPTLTDTAAYVGIRRTVDGDATFKLTLGAEGYLTGTVTGSGNASGVKFVHNASSGTESIAITDLAFDRSGNLLNASFDATVNGEADIYTIRLVRG